MARGAMIGRLRNIGPQDYALSSGVQGLYILVIDTYISNVGEGEGNYLARITGIGQNFLISCEGSIETNFTHCA